MYLEFTEWLSTSFDIIDCVAGGVGVVMRMSSSSLVQRIDYDS